MSRLIDLTPTACRESMRKRRAVFRWVIGYGALLGLLLATNTVLNMGIAPLRAERASLEAEVTDRWTRHTEIQALQAERARIIDTIDRHNRLASPVQITELVRLIAAATPDEVTLTYASIAPREDRSRKRSGKEAPTRVISTTYLSVELEGVATGDGPLTRFVAALADRGVLDSVVLEYARSKEIGPVTGRVFRVSARVALDKYYEFVEADAEGGS